MKLQDYGEEFLFDEFPQVFNPVQRIIFTHLPQKIMSQLPKKLPKIYTTETIARRLADYFHWETTGNQFVIVKPFEPVNLLLSDGKKVKLLVCEEKSVSRNLMVFIRKENKTHLYAGICSHIRSIVLTDIFVEWVHNGVDRLYVDLKRARDDCDPRELNNAIDAIEDMVEPRKPLKIHVVTPLFGSEFLLAKLAHRLRARVHLSSIFARLYGNELNLQHFQSDKEAAKIFITHLERTPEEIKEDYENNQTITVNLTSSEPVECEVMGYYELCWSPLPTPYHLKRLAAWVQPSHIFGIIHKNTPLPKLPFYLRELCRIPPNSLSHFFSSFQSVESNEIESDKKTLGPSKEATPTFCIKKTNVQYLDDSDDSND